uniref:CMP/dCMP-type deaminase domain-containing protein n=1 Tax=viral metagenome TaxID=1070528 RepID=A0A6C0KU24_9ZZZZ
MQLYSKKFFSVLRLLIQESHFSTRIHKHACAILRGGKIIDISNNNIKNRVANHAEQNLLYRWKNCTLHNCILFVVRVVQGDKFADSKPCFHCVQNIKKSGIKKVVFSTNSGFEIMKSTELQNSHLTLHYRK